MFSVYKKTYPRRRDTLLDWKTIRPSSCWAGGTTKVTVARMWSTLEMEQGFSRYYWGKKKKSYLILQQQTEGVTNDTRPLVVGNWYRSRQYKTRPNTADFLIASVDKIVPQSMTLDLGLMNFCQLEHFFLTVWQNRILLGAAPERPHRQPQWPICPRHPCRGH